MCRIAFCAERVRERKRAEKFFSSLHGDFVCSFVYLFAICCEALECTEKERGKEPTEKRERECDVRPVQANYARSQGKLVPSL